MMFTQNPFSGDGAVTMITPGHTFELIDPSAWQGHDPPEREWVLDGWLPRNRAAYLTGAGGAGKSLLGQQLATCIALGLPFLGLETSKATALYLTAEDDQDELQRRQRAICRAVGVEEQQLARELILVSLFGRSDNEMVDFGNERALRKLPAWESLISTARVTSAKFIVLDNVSHIFAGSEIDRVQVTAFASLLNGLANEIGGAVLLIGHPNKAGDEYSGVTAWTNAFRARLFFDAPKGEHARGDPDARQLSLPKANYARQGSTIAVRWYEGALIRDDQLPESVAEQIRQVSVHTAANDAFLRCLDVATKQKRHVSHMPGVNYAPKQFSQMMEGRGFTSDDFKDAMERLAHLGLIAFEQKLWKGENYHWKVGIARTEGIRQASANPKSKHEQEWRNSAKNDPPTPVRQASANPPENPQKTVRQPLSANPSPDELDWT